jgi:hypothetical protein
MNFCRFWYVVENVWLDNECFSWALLFVDRVQELELAVTNMRAQHEQLQRHIKDMSEQKAKLEVTGYLTILYS